MSLSSSIGTASDLPVRLFRDVISPGLAGGSITVVSAASRSERPVQGPHVRIIVSASRINAAAARSIRPRFQMSALAPLSFVFRSDPPRPLGCPWLFRIVLDPTPAEWPLCGHRRAIRLHMFHDARRKSRQRKRAGPRSRPYIWEISAWRSADHSAYMASMMSL